MAIYGYFSGIFKGSASGTSEKGKDWVSLKFILEENVNGADVPAVAMIKPNISIFPPDGDYSDLKDGQQYVLKLAPTTRKDNSQVNYNLISYKPKQ